MFMFTDHIGNKRQWSQVKMWKSEYNFKVCVLHG